MDYSEYGEAAYLERMYEQHQRDEQRRLLATVTTPEEDDKARSECQEMFNTVVGDESYVNKCLAGEPVFYYPYPKALIPGHIYSMAGRDEFYISRSCEYHFDEWMKEPEDDDLPE